MLVEKISISLRPESLMQLEYLREHLFSAPIPVPRSQLIQWIISDSYFKCLNNDKLKN